MNTQLAVLGGGPGGYAAAFLAADLGMQVTLIDQEKDLGGVLVEQPLGEDVFGSHDLISQVLIVRQRPDERQDQRAVPPNGGAERHGRSGVSPATGNLA